MIKLMVLRNMKLKTLTIPRRNHSQTKIIHFPLKKLYKNCIILINIQLKLVSKVMLKILQARLQQQVNHEIAGAQAGFRRGRGTKDQIANIRWIMEKTSISASLTIQKPLTVWITINWKILKEMRISDHLTCLLRNLYAGQEATVRTGHGTNRKRSLSRLYIVTLLI